MLKFNVVFKERSFFLVVAQAYNFIIQSEYDLIFFSTFQSHPNILFKKSDQVRLFDHKRLDPTYSKELAVCPLQVQRTSMHFIWTPLNNHQILLHFTYFWRDIPFFVYSLLALLNICSYALSVTGCHIAQSITLLILVGDIKEITFNYYGSKY